MIGGGLHGLSAALHLARRGRRVRVLEARRVGAHASGYSAGGVRTLGRHLADDLADLVVIADGEVRASSDVDQDATRTLQLDVFEERTVNGRFGRLTRTVLTRGYAAAHHGGAQTRTGDCRRQSSGFISAGRRSGVGSAA